MLQSSSDDCEIVELKPLEHNEDVMMNSQENLGPGMLPSSDDREDVERRLLQDSEEGALNSGPAVETKESEASVMVRHDAVSLNVEPALLSNVGSDAVYSNDGVMCQDHGADADSGALTETLNGKGEMSLSSECIKVVRAYSEDVDMESKQSGGPSMARETLHEARRPGRRRDMLYMDDIVFLSERPGGRPQRRRQPPRPGRARPVPRVRGNGMQRQWNDERHVWPERRLLRDALHASVEAGAITTFDLGPYYHHTEMVVRTYMPSPAERNGRARGQRAACGVWGPRPPDMTRGRRGHRPQEPRWVRRGQRRAPVTRIACYGCGGPHRMRHCTQTSENMRVRIWALLRRRDMEQPCAGIGDDASDPDMPGLIPDPATTEQKQEAPPRRREGAPPPVGTAASASAPPDEISLEEAAATGRPPDGGRRYGAAAAASRHMPCARCSGRHQTRECPVPWAQPHPSAMAAGSRRRGCFGCGGDHDIGDCYVVDHCLTSKGWAQRYRRQICYGCGGPHHLKQCRLSPATKDVIWAKVRLQCVPCTWRMFIHGAAGGGSVSRRPA